MSGGGRSGRVLAALLGLALAWTPGAQAATAAAEPSIRVLIYRGTGAVPIELPGRRRVTLRSQAQGLLLDSRPIGHFWQTAAPVIAANGMRLRGTLEARREGSGLLLINRVPLEGYVAGTVGREIYPDWSPETLKAQAVATRTYALYQAAQKRSALFDVEATTTSQVYGGLDAESFSVWAATNATRGEILVWGNAPILAAFHSSSGGRSAAAGEVWGRGLPYLVSQNVAGEQDSPDTYWRITLPGTKLGRSLVPLGVRVGAVRSLRVLDRSPSGRARTLEVRGDSGVARVDARKFRDAVGPTVVRSTLFDTKDSAEGIVIVGSGHGHGVGMSQWGAEAMARRGANYRQILAHFYPGTRLQTGAAR